MQHALSASAHEHTHTHTFTYTLKNYKFKMFINIQSRNFNTSSERIKYIIFTLFKYILHLTQKGRNS